MLSKYDLKILFRSGSWRFMLDARPLADPVSIGTYVLRGKPIYYRRGASEVDDLYKILLKSGKKAEYYVAAAERIDTILDIGANIGLTSIYFAGLFPQARIYAFEPVPGNFEILSRNVRAYPNITAFPFALGSGAGRLAMYYSDSSRNFGGFSFFEAGSNTQKTVAVEMRDVRKVIEEIGLSTVDLIKIDAEGSEYDILTALDGPILQSVRWIVGELHGERSFDLLAFLSRGYDIGMKKQLNKRLFNFVARRRA